MRLLRLLLLTRWSLLSLLLLSLMGCVVQLGTLPTPTPLPTATPPPTPTVETVAAQGLGVPARVVAEHVSMDAPVVAMGWQSIESEGQAISTWNVPENEAGWHVNSAEPGQGSNIVISGHNNSTGGRVFAQLESLEVGDSVTLWTDQGRAQSYQVRDKQIVRTFAASQETLNYLQAVIAPTASEQLTLISCWPSWTNTHRLIVVAEPQ